MVGNKLRILLIRPKPPKETIGLQHVMICEPLELEYLAGNVDKRAVSVKIIDMILEKKPIEFFIKKYKPHIVGMTAYITHVGVVKKMARDIKSVSKKIVTVVGGVHAEVVPEDFISKYIDCIICSKPIDTFLKIIDNVMSKEDIKHIDGTYIKGKKYLKTPSFNYLPPDRSSVSKYRKKYYYMFHNPCALIKTSLGCPYTCSFCFCKEITGGKYYVRKLDEVIKELESIKEREVYIVDDDFLFNERL